MPPVILKNLPERGLLRGIRGFAELAKRRVLHGLIGAQSRAYATHDLALGLSRRMLLSDVHQAFGGELRALIQGLGQAFCNLATHAIFLRSRHPRSYNGYGSTEACTAITLSGFEPFRADTVGKPLPGSEVRIVDPGPDGIGEVTVRSQTVMSHYLDDPALTSETIVDGWLMTGDLGRLDASAHLQLFGRKRNMIVTAEGKNIYPEDIENVFEGLGVKELCIFAANYLWPQRSMVGEQLVMVLHPEPSQNPSNGLLGDLAARNQKLLP